MVPSSGGAFNPTRSRGVGRALAQREQHQLIALADIHHQADLQAEIVDAVGYVGQRGMYVVALSAQAEELLVGMVPHAAGRLQFIGDVVALQVADVISQTVRRVSR
jgi:hypothetical protein